MDLRLYTWHPIDYYLQEARRLDLHYIPDSWLNKRHPAFLLS